MKDIKYILEAVYRKEKNWNDGYDEIVKIINRITILYFVIILFLLTASIIGWGFAIILLNPAK